MTPGYSASPEKHPPEAHASKCTLHTLKGRYLFGGISHGSLQTIQPPSSSHCSRSPALVCSRATAPDTGTVTVSLNGAVVLENGVFPITYTVNPDCSGTLTVPAWEKPSVSSSRPTGDELIVIGTTPGAVLVHGPSRRV